MRALDDAEGVVDTRWNWKGITVAFDPAVTRPGDVLAAAVATGYTIRYAESPIEPAR